MSISGNNQIPQNKPPGDGTMYHVTAKALPWVCGIIGGVIGSVVPGPGTALGFLAGGAIGTGIGSIAGIFVDKAGNDKDAEYVKYQMQPLVDQIDNINRNAINTMANQMGINVDNTANYPAGQQNYQTHENSQNNEKPEVSKESLLQPNMHPSAQALASGKGFWKKTKDFLFGKDDKQTERPTQISKPEFTENSKTEIAKNTQPSGTDIRPNQTQAGIRQLSPQDQANLNAIQQMTQQMQYFQYAMLAQMMADRKSVV